MERFPWIIGVDIPPINPHIPYMRNAAEIETRPQETPMTEATKKMIQRFLADYNGDSEKTASYISELVECGIREAREIVAQASK